MRFGPAAALGVLLCWLAPPTEAQTAARIFVVMVDDARFKPSEARNAEQMLALLRDQILTEADLVGIVSTGPSGVATDLHSPADPRRLNDSIRKIATSASSMTAVPSSRPGPTTNPHGRRAGPAPPPRAGPTWPRELAGHSRATAATAHTV